MKLLTAEEVRELDRQTIEQVGIPGAVLMENAGRQAVAHLLRRFGSLRPGPVLVLAGKGNNGGDGYVIARCLLDLGWRVRTLVLGERQAIGGDAGINLEVLLKLGGAVEFAADAAALAEALQRQEPPALIVDALLGTGLSSQVGGLYARAVDWINASGARVLAVDVPSGVDATTGRILGKAVRADLTVTFAAAKVGLAVYPAAERVGELAVAEIGIPAALSRALPDRHLLVEAGEAAALLPARPAAGHKGTFGHLLVVAGSTGKSGAAAMTAEGALRAGAGLVTVGCPRSIHPTLEVKLTEAMTAPLDEVDGGLSLQAQEQVRELWAGKQVLAIGPGLGLADETRALVRHLVRECPLPVVLDADGLNSLEGKPAILNQRTAGTAVLTPHPGEMARLTGLSIAEVEADRLGVARRFATAYGAVLVLKGARTVIALPDGRLRINASGNPGLATGGMGDVLTGLIAGLIAQGSPAEEAAVLGVFLHGLAADRLRKTLGEAGMTASDLLRELPAARRELTQQGECNAQG
ncbi:bifunctional NAD(P)H-hydrate repair enzyme [Desulfuromonas versatilis]|uniref:Bifunctional NAD(P)H-hydrate repair enzyme n=1 Tax=Desulfuromonas versatilis TaxID=2802975 RepID=A0ABM8HTY4_9BACT|nr:NAD(P)H-hydrate dehydratase [Desulfuromonas versatilis]BCR04098.1 bifunctional NAD(P)H-hydrate repair enzyme [Desulfuromonas versatilis]